MHVLPYYHQISLGGKFDRSGAASDQSGASITKLCANLKQKMQILSVLIAQANAVLITQSAKYGSAKCK